MPGATEQERTRIRELKAQTVQLKALLEDMRIKVCSDPALYPGGAENYRYVPEQCVPKRVRGARPATTAPRRATQEEQTERARLQAAIDAIHLPPMQPLPEPTGDVTHREYAHVRVMHSMKQMPRFLAFALPRFKQLTHDFPDPEERYKHVCSLWEGTAKFHNNKELRSSLFQLALA